MSNRIPLYPFQVEAVSFLREREGRAGLFMGMGTGKTRVALAYLDEVDARVILVVCPLSAIGVWRREIRKLRLRWKVLSLRSGSVPKRAELLARMPSGRTPRIVLVNYSVYWKEFCRVCKRDIGAKIHLEEDRAGYHVYRRSPLSMRNVILKLKPDSIIMDEAHRLKGRSTRQSRFAHTLAQADWAKRRLALTGSPVDEGTEDLFSIYKFIDTSIFGSIWADFDKRYIVRGGYNGYQIKGYKNVAEVKRKMSKSAFQITKEEALDLPERVTTLVPVTLSPRTREIYNRMKADALVKLQVADPFGKPRTGTSFASIVLTEIIRLQQITSGFLPIDYGKGEREIVNLGTDKLQVTLDLVEIALANREKVVIFCRFRYDLGRLKQAIPKAGVIAGDVSSESRDAVIDRLQKGDLDVLLVQIATGSESIDLTAASVAIFYSYSHSLLQFNQARDRLHRHGQTKRVLEYILVAEKSVDESVIKALRKKQRVSRQVTTVSKARTFFR